MRLWRIPLLAVLITAWSSLQAQPQPGVAYLPFDGDLRDATGHGHEPTTQEPSFEAGQVGQALRIGAQRVAISDRPELQAAPGLRLDCWVKLPPPPAEGQTVLVKNNEYMLRQDPIREGARFSFFVHLGGWEPRVRSEAPVEPGVWYHLVAVWDGVALSLEVNGARTRVARSGPPQPTANPLIIGAPGQSIDELKIDNPRLPVVRVRSVAQERGVLRAGQPERLTFTIENVGSAAGPTTAALELPAGVACLSGGLQELGPLAMGSSATASWTVQAEAATSAAAVVKVNPAGAPPLVHRQTLAFLPARDPQPAELLKSVVTGGGTTWYVDSVAGRNSNAGTSPEAPWQDFTNINGKSLGPGDRLLIKRGSVINQELSLSAHGTPERWAEIGAYGAGPRPTIRRNWHIDDRCALITNPDYLRISSLVVCYAAKGLMAVYHQEGHAGLVVEDCIAHHIEGLYRTNSHGIPEWRDRPGPTGDGWNSSAGFGVAGARPRDILFRECEMFQCSWGFMMAGDGLIVDRVYCHDNYVHNTSPHPALVSTRRSYLQNSVFDAPGWHAFAGTMGIMLVNPEGLVIRNCTWRNQPDSGSHDEGGIDFENSGNGCLIDHCTFERNAGAAIEVLGLTAPQPRNLEIAGSRFIQNNVAKKLGPAEIYIWGKSQNAEVSCSTGTIHDNGYTTNEGVEFFVNEAPKTTSWSLRDNVRYSDPAALREAMPFNEPPVVDAGPDLRTERAEVALRGRVTDDNRPKAPAVRWEVIEGPGPVTFADDAAAETTARIEQPGSYLLRLVADDGELWLSDLVTIHRLPPGGSVAAAWEFNRPLDKEGWSEVNPGTAVENWPNQRFASRAEPVRYVAGGYFILAIKDSPDAHLLSPDNLGLDLAASPVVKLRLQNRTGAQRFRLRFSTEAEPGWDETRSREFAVLPDSPTMQECVVDLGGVAGWQGRLKQLRLDFATGSPVTGTCRLDYVWLGNHRLAAGE